MNYFILKALKARFLQKIFGKPLEVKKSWEEAPLDFKGMVDFLNWFDATKSISSCINKAASDWKYRFSSHAYFTKLNKKNALEIGFGGGRLMTQSSKDFVNVYGVDIHRNFPMTTNFLASQGVNNYSLYHRDDISQIKSNSIDLIYSFIVFQHFDSLEEVDYYLKHIYRLLNKEGIAHIYFGKNKNNGVSVTSEKDFILRDCSLFINPVTMRAKIAKRFVIINFEDNLARDPVKNLGESVQAMIVFKKK